MTDTTEKFTVSGKFIDGLLALEFERGIKEGRAQGATEKTALELCDDNGTRSSVHIITAKSRRALSREIANRNRREDTGCGADCTGRAFAWSCQLLRAYRDGNRWHGVCVSSVYFDV